MRVPKLLIVSPHFPPINAPDHQRVRMALPYLVELGWKITVLCVRADDVEGVREPELEFTVPPEVCVEPVSAVPLSLGRFLGARTLGWRSLMSLRNRGAKLLSDGQYDVVYLSSTVFLSFLLGPHWKRRFGVPYVLDYQDRWRNDYYREHRVTPPGGRFKFGLSQLWGTIFEKSVATQAAAITAVSPAYIDQLVGRYSGIRREKCHVLPFGAAENDFAQLDMNPDVSTLLAPDPPKRNYVYVGRVGPDMVTSIRVLFRVVHALVQENPKLGKSIKLWFIGTSYAPHDLASPQVLPLAEELGIADLVREIPNRVPYFSALRTLSESDGTFLIGSDDIGYSPSKIYPYILAQRPLFAVFPQSNQAVKIVRECTEANVIVLDEYAGENVLNIAARGQLQAFFDLGRDSKLVVDRERFAPYTAEKMAETLASILSSKQVIY